MICYLPIVCPVAEPVPHPLQVVMEIKPHVPRHVQFVAHSLEGLWRRLVPQHTTVLQVECEGVFQDAHRRHVGTRSITIRRIIPLREWEVWDDPDTSARAVTTNAMCLKWARHQTSGLCWMAVRENPLAYMYVHPDTDNDNIRMEAVRQQPNTIALMDTQNEDIQLAAVRQQADLLSYCKFPSQRVCLCAVKKDGMALQHMLRSDKTTSLAAVEQNGLALQYVRDQDIDICMAAVKQNGLALQYVTRQEYRICVAAVRQNFNALKFIKNMHV